MASLISVAGIYTGTDKAVSKIVACSKGSLYVRAVVGVNIDCVVRAFRFSGGNKLAYNVVAIGTVRVLSADGNLSLGTLKT